MDYGAWEPPKATFGIEVNGELVTKMALIQLLLEIIDMVPLVGGGLGWGSYQNADEYSFETDPEESLRGRKQAITGRGSGGSGGSRLGVCSLLPGS